MKRSIRPISIGDPFSGRIITKRPFGIFVESQEDRVGFEQSGLVEIWNLGENTDIINERMASLNEGDFVDCVVIYVDASVGIRLSMLKEDFTKYGITFER
jgi:predicted RNA-binding protein with RPS1 domain